MSAGNDGSDRGWFTPPPPERPFGAPATTDGATASPTADGRTRGRRNGPVGTRPPHRQQPRPVALPPECKGRAAGAAGPRLAARVIDGVIVVLTSFLVAFPLWLSYLDHAMELARSARGVGSRSVTVDEPTYRLVLLCTVATVAVYFAYELLQTAIWGRTIGKWAVGLTVIDGDTGEKPSWNRAAARAAVFTLPPILPTLGLLIVAFDSAWLLRDQPLKRCWHDKIARTRVVQT